MLARTKTYRPSDKEPFMNERQRDYFRLKLLAWREDILKEAKETLLHLQEENQNHPDIADRASSETDRASVSTATIENTKHSDQHRNFLKCPATRAGHIFIGNEEDSSQVVLAAAR